MTPRSRGWPVGPRRRWTAALVALGAMTWAASARAEDEGVFERSEVNVSPAEGDRIARLAIDNRLGDVRIEGHDGAGVIIVAVKRAPDYDTLDRLKVSLVPDAEGLRIGTSIAIGEDVRPVAAGTVAIDLFIRAPRSARADAAIWNGALALVGMDNGGDLSARAGSIDVRNCSGDISTHIVRGKQSFEEVFGVVDASGLAGDLALEVIRGDRLDASVHDGKVVGRKVSSKQVAIRTTRGDIEIQDAQLIAGGAWSVRSHHGDVSVTFETGGASLRVLAASRSGRVRLARALSPTPRTGGAVLGAFGHGGRAALIALQSRLGDVNVQLAVIEP